QPLQALERLSSLKNATQQALRTPNVQSFRTSQGTRVLFVAAPELPMIDIRLTFDAGSARDQTIGTTDGTSLSGLASLTAQLLFEATSTQNTDQIAASFEALGAQYGAAAYRDMFTVELRSLTDPAYLQPALTLWLDALRDAQFPASSVTRILQSAETGQKQRKDSPSAVASIRFWRELYGTHPYAEPSTGNMASLKNLTVQQVEQFRQRYLVASNTTIALTGNLTRTQAAALAERIAGSLPLGTPATALTDPQPLSAARLVHVPFNASQSHIIIGQIGVKRSAPAADLAALAVANNILGGDGFTARLTQELREKRGLTYGAYSSFVQMRSNGPFMINYSTRGDQAAASIEIAKQTLRNFVAQGVTDDAVEEAKQGMLNSYPLSLSSNSNINGFLGMIGFYDLPMTYLADYPAQITAVTATDVNRVLQQYLQPEQLLTVVVGQPLTSPAVDDATVVK
ncbi:MAG: pitrilysin family protein, partial [Moraxellaceae bacterium]